MLLVVFPYDNFGEINTIIAYSLLINTIVNIRKIFKLVNHSN